RAEVSRVDDIARESPIGVDHIAREEPRKVDAVRGCGRPLAQTRGRHCLVGSQRELIGGGHSRNRRRRGRSSDRGRYEPPARDRPRPRWLGHHTRYQPSEREPEWDEQGDRGSKIGLSKSLAQKRRETSGEQEEHGRGGEEEARTERTPFAPERPVADENGAEQ